MEQTKDPLMSLHSWSWTIKTKPFFWNSYFKVSFTLFINTLLTNQDSLHIIKPKMMILIVLGFLQKISPLSTIKPALSWGKWIIILLAIHWINVFYTDDGQEKLIARQSIYLNDHVEWINYYIHWDKIFIPYIWMSC